MWVVWWRDKGSEVHKPDMEMKMSGIKYFKIKMASTWQFAKRSPCDTVHFTQGKRCKPHVADHTAQTWVIKQN